MLCLRRIKELRCYNIFNLRKDCPIMDSLVTLSGLDAGLIKAVFDKNDIAGQQFLQKIAK